VDGSGLVVDGDRILGVLALERLSRAGASADDPLTGTLVVSVLSNGGLRATLGPQDAHDTERLIDAYFGGA